MISHDTERRLLTAAVLILDVAIIMTLSYWVAQWAETGHISQFRAVVLFLYFSALTAVKL